MPVNSVDLLIAGAGGHGRELQAYILDLQREDRGLNFLGFVDDGLTPGVHGGAQVLGGIDRGPDFGRRYITAFGSNVVRRAVVGRMEALGETRMEPWTLIHPRAYIGASVEVGEGSCIAPGAIVTARVRIGRHCILNVKASISHDCVLGDYVNVNPAATVCGSVTIGEGAYIGAGAVVKERISVGAWSVIGAGAAVVRDIPAGATAVGVPARIVKQA